MQIGQMHSGCFLLGSAVWKQFQWILHFALALLTLFLHIVFFCQVSHLQKKLNHIEDLSEVRHYTWRKLLVYINIKGKEKNKELHTKTTTLN